MRWLVAIGAILAILSADRLLALWGDYRERLTYAALIAEKDSLAAEVSLCQRTTTQVWARLGALEAALQPAVRRRRR